MARVRLLSRDGCVGMAGAGRFLEVGLSTLKLWVKRGEIVPDKVVKGRKRFRRDTLEKFKERIEYVQKPFNGNR